jgi:hypothetical protein
LRTGLERHDSTMTPQITDNARDEITASVNGRQACGSTMTRVAFDLAAKLYDLQSDERIPFEVRLDLARLTGAAAFIHRNLGRYEWEKAA